MPSSPLIEESNILSYTIKSGGSEIPNTYEVMSMEITQNLMEISRAEIEFRDGSAPKQSFTISNADTFKPGTEVIIELGYHSKNEQVFSGVVTKQTIRINEGSAARLVVSLRDKSDKLTKGRKRINFVDKKDSDIIQSIIENASLQADVVATTFQYKELTQNDASDWDFINLRAAKNGLVVSTDAGKVTVAKPSVSDEAALQVQFGYDMLDFDTEIDASNQYSGVECSAWDLDTQKMISATATKPTLNEQGNLTEDDLSGALSPGTLKLSTSGSLPQDELQNWANGVAEILALSRFRGSVTFHGSAQAKVNSTIKLIGLSDRFDGNAYITGVTHNVENGHWHTRVQIGMEPNSFAEDKNIASPTASGVVPGVDGLQTGIVTKINDDPNNDFRVQVQMPILGDDAQPVWARLATFYASNSFGAYFMPEVNDEVILGFMNNDPTYPIIVGSVYSSKNAAPETPDEKNTIKTLITQSKLQLKFDDENKVFTILTPGGNTMVFSDQDKGITITDQNNNKMEFNDSGITVTDKSSNKIEMTSSGITVNSQSDLTLQASQGVTIKGMTVEINADQSFKATGGTAEITGNQTAQLSGNAQCTVTSSGQTNVKGTMVNIN